MRIGTWNVECAYEKRIEAIRAKLRDHPADIWVLTETHDDLKPAGCNFVAHSRPRPRLSNNVRAGSRWVSIWSRYPIFETIETDGADLERTVVARIDAGRDRDIVVYGTVLPWKGDEQIQNWDKHHRVIAEQGAEWRELTERFPSADLVVAGDFNSDMFDGRRYGTKRGVADLRQSLRTCDLFCATSPDFLSDLGLPMLPIDHIALPTRWQAATELAAAWPADRRVHSDHSGLVIEVGDPPRAA